MKSNIGIISATILMIFTFTSVYPQKVNDRLTRQDSIYHSSDSDLAAMYYNKGHDSFENGNAKEAISYYRRAIFIDSMYVDAYDNLGVIYRRTGVLDSAEYFYLKSLAVMPNGKMANQNLAVVYESNKRLDKALTQYQKYQKLFPDDPEGYFGAARIYTEMEKYKEAIVSGKKAEDLYAKAHDRWIGDSQFIVGLSYYMLDDKKNARIYFDKAE